VYETAEQRDADAARIAREKYNGRSVAELLTDEEFGADNTLATLRKRVNIRGTLLSELFDAIDSNVPRDSVSPQATDTRAINEQLKNDLFDLWLTMLPEQAFRKQFISRKGRAGFRVDLRRNMAAHVAKVAPALARLKYGNELRSDMERIQQMAKTDPNNLGPVRDAVQNRVNKIMSPDKRGFWDAFAGYANKVAYLTYLTGAATALLQPFGLIISGLPILSGNHKTNPFTVAKELLRATMDWRQYGVAHKLPDGTIKYEAPSLANGKSLTDDERRAVKAMVDLNIATNTFSGFLWDATREEVSEAVPARTAVGKAKQAAGTAVDIVVNAPLRNVERLTREAMYLAAYRLGRARGLSESAAIAQAAEDTNEALGNYSAESRPTWMQGPAGRMATAMKMYPVVVTQQLVGSFLSAIKPLDGKTRAQAITKFVGILMTTGMIAGAYNMPLADLVINAVTAMLKDIDDDDLPEDLKKKDPQLWFKNVFMPELLGNREIFGVPLDRIIGEGPLSAFTNRAFGKRLGMNDLWFRDGKPTASTSDALTAFLIGLGGPFLSYGMSVAKGIDDMMIGDTERGIERMVPLAALRNVMTANRAMEKGYDTTRGVIVPPEDVSKADLIWQILGFSPADVDAARELSFKASGIEQRTLNQRTLITRRIKHAFRERNMARVGELVRTEVQNFNRKNPTYELTAKQIEEMLLEDAKARAMTRAGTPISEKNIAILREALSNMEARVRERK
jgi:hypothetical protein